MDPITHGIAGSLLGKSFFSRRNQRVAIFAAILGAVFPDVDTVADFISRDPLAMVKYHRGITHSFIALPFFAAALAWITRRLAPKFGYEPPSTAMLTFIFGTGIASHILMDGTTSFGTRMWTPFSSRRVAWDMIFIVDLMFTSILLVPQVIAWVYSDAARARARAAQMWVLFSGAAVAGWGVGAAMGFSFRAWVIPVASIVFALAFFGPGFVAGGWAFSVNRLHWCRLGVYAALAYALACSIAHHLALAQVVNFAHSNRISVDRIGALPLAPSVFSWGAGIRSRDGDYQSQFDLRNIEAINFHYSPDSPRDQNISRAMSLPDARLFWDFSRFPSIHEHKEEGFYVIDIGENRYINRPRSPHPFTYTVVFNSAGEIMEDGMTADGMFFSAHAARRVTTRAARRSKISMKILLFSDIHSSQKSLNRILSQPADLYIDAGDLVSFQKGLIECGETLKNLGSRLWVLPGNHETHEDTKSLCDRFGFIDFHRQVRTLSSAAGPTYWAGLGYSNITPFNTPGEYTEEQIAEALAAFEAYKPLYLVVHFPPGASKLDEFSSGRHAGSPSLRAWVERVQPLYLFCGHIHETAGRTDTIGTTKCINVGTQGLMFEL